MATDHEAVLGVVLDESAGTQYLTFLLADEQYGLNILQVQEIRGWEAVTRVPNTPAYVKGVINLRGTIVPVLDLRRRFNLADTEYTKETVVIVVRTTEGDGAERSLGLVVDAVSDVLVAQDDDIASTPDFGAGVPTENILGLLNDNGRMVTLLDVGSLIVDEPAPDADVDSTAFQAAFDRPLAD